MIRKARSLDPSAMDPTPDQIRERTQAIRDSWSPRERVRRSGFKRVSWYPPLFADTDLPSFLASEFESR